eukprot:TRINITY_DN4808_c0_g1_i1.p1 TRINITY_DN4808_c0_g1~~TRINITY_DN4808_c0_g1_i1.p1  ORF type:complete len:333 (+),score=63.07 TRINITY_DN4808_c0_g1_i1:113-1111(+)
MRVKMNGQYSQSCSTLPRAGVKGRPRNLSQGDLKRNSAASYTRLERHPSQANMWSTTVPQSLVNQKLGSRHAPTRSSLRHSRMLVLSRSSGGAVPRKYLPPVVEQIPLGTALVSIQFIFGVILTALAGYSLIWSPHLVAQDVPHYSGLAFLLSGWIGLMLVTCCRHHYPGTRQVGCVFPVKFHHIMMAVLITGFSVLFGIFAFVFHSLHFYSLLLKPTCREIPLPISAPEWFSKLLDLTREKPPVSCRCEGSSPFGSTLEYPGLPCSDVLSVYTGILGSSAVLNLLATGGASWFVLLLLQNRRPAQLQSSSSSSTTSNDSETQILQRRKSIV